jgi:hypothetical protein
VSGFTAGFRAQRNSARQVPTEACVANATEFGALAQLGERLLCKQDVIGSIPIGSTILSLALGEHLIHEAKKSNTP